MTSQLPGTSMSVQWFVFPDDGRYVGCVENGCAEGPGLSLGPQQRGEYAGTYRGGYETSGVYSADVSSSRDGRLPESGSFVYEGEWADGRRNGLGVDRRGNWVFRGEWSQGFRGRYGVRQHSLSAAGYGGTWTSGLPDGYGVETYTDGSTYKGQWMRGVRHGYGTRQSASYKLASTLRAVSPSSFQQKSLSTKPFSIVRSPIDTVVAKRDLRVETLRGGFVLLASTTVPEPPRKRGLLLDRHGRPNLSKTIMWQFRRQGSSSSLSDSRASSFRSTDGRRGGSVRSAIVSSNSSNDSSSESIFIDDDACSFISLEDAALMSTPDIRETYRGEWKNDKRSGYGVCDRSDGLKYEGEWLNNRKHGYGSTTLPNGNRISGKYKNNILVTSVDTKGILAPFRSNKINDRVTFAIEQSRRAADNAEQKVEMASARMAGAEERAISAEIAARKALNDADAARKQASYIMSHTDPRSDLTLKIHCPSENVFLLEHDPMDKEYLFTDSLKPKKKRFSLLPNRPRANSLTNNVGIDNKLRTDPVNQSPASLQHNQLPFGQGLGRSSDRYSSSTPQRAQQPVDLSVRPAAGHEKTQPATISRLSSIPGYNQQLDTNQKRRNSLPSIVKENVIEEIPVAMAEQYPAGNKPSSQAGMTKSMKRTETYIIENGVHKRVKSTYEEDMKAAKAAAQRNQGAGALSQLIRSSFQAGSASTKPRPSVEEQFEKMYKTESPHLKRKPGMGSTPDVSASLKVDILPREQVYVMSQRRREELILERAAAERRKQNHIVVSFGGMKEWIGQHVLFVCFMFINGLIAIFLMRLI